MAKRVLPYKWREKAKQILDRQGIELNLQQITDIKGGKYTDETLTKSVMKVVTSIQKEHAAKLRRIARLTAKKKQA